MPIDDPMLLDYLSARFHLFATMTPQDDKAIATLFARKNELLQLARHFGAVEQLLRLGVPVPQ